jgi:hypothetical protein
MVEIAVEVCEREGGARFIAFELYRGSEDERTYECSMWVWGFLWGLYLVPHNIVVARPSDRFFTLTMTSDQVIDFEKTVIAAEAIETRCGGSE